MIEEASTKELPIIFEILVLEDIVVEAQQKLLITDVIEYYPIKQYHFKTQESYIQGNEINRWDVKKKQTSKYELALKP